MLGSPVFGIDTSAWLAEHRRTTAALIDRVWRRTETRRSRRDRRVAATAAGCGELACC